ncbi:MAG: NAD(P)H-hydrate epimerase [Candidatus Omnitrophica bacterium]|jgi:NAD(P)H-hydrate epimerase|nr:NAD(P)H-hydrate epimerase [Candidatus Omnitrophota bacterium]
MREPLFHKPKKLLTKSQARAIDKKTINTYGIPAAILMENAGVAIAAAVFDIIQKSDKNKGAVSVCIFCGKGNNGGDGLVCARYLLSAGYDVNIYLMCQKAQVRGISYFNLLALKRINRNIHEILTSRDINTLKKPAHSDIIIDAVFGTGFNGKAEGIYKDVITLINKSPAYTISADIPSGLDADSGKKRAEAVKADMTVTMGLAKKGFYQNDGPGLCGDIRIADIGLRP